MLDKGEEEKAGNPDTELNTSETDGVATNARNKKDPSRREFKKARVLVLQYANLIHNY